jgi:O-antigen ligase
MLNPAVAQKLKLIVVCAIGLWLAVFLGTQIGSAKYGPLLLGAVVIVVASVSLFTGRFFWVLTIASSFLGGTFPILGGAFTPFQIMMMIGVGKFLIGDVVLRRTKIRAQNRVDVLLIAGFMAVLTWHGVHDRFGMKFLGSSIWGGHNYVNVYVGLAAFFVTQSIPMNPRIWSRLPYAVLVVASFDLLIAVITTISPRLIYFIYPFYSAVSSSGMEEIVSGASSDVTGRIGTFGNFGFTIILIVLASVSLREMLSARYFLRLVCLAGGFVAALFSGFRSAVLNSFIGLLAAGIRDLKFGVLLLLPLFATAVFTLSVVNSEFIRLPKPIQRALTFAPGKWDPEVASDANASNEFRRQVWAVFNRDYFPAHPWLGRGFGFRRQFAQQSVYKYNPNWDRETVEVGNIHNGFLSTLDAFGIIGTVFFIIWNLRLLARIFRVSFREGGGAATALRFLALYLAVWIISYWFGALNVGSFLPVEFALVGVFLRLQHDLAQESTQSQPVVAELERDQRPGQKIYRPIESTKAR